MSTNLPQSLGKYELRERLGRGGMAEVWKAYDPQLKRYVAIKYVQANLRADPAFATRFVREAQAVASLRHPNIVRIYDFETSTLDSDESMAYMVMDYVEGQTLADYVRSNASAHQLPSASEIVHLFTPLAAAIGYAHQHGIIHRDIKPANILLDKHNTSHNPMGEPILTDFGVAKLLGTSTGVSSGLWHGTELYISPEQAQGYVGNELSDLYSLGIILYEICTGKLPFRSDNPTEIMMQHINTMPPAPALINPNIPPALSAVILRSIAKDPSTRFPDATSMAVALAEAFGLPIPKNLDVAATSMDTVGVTSPTDKFPTYYKPRQDDMTPSSPASSAELEIVKTSTPPPATLTTGSRRFAGGSASGPVVSNPLQSTSPGAISSSTPSVAAISSAGTPPAPPSPLQISKRRP